MTDAEAADWRARVAVFLDRTGEELESRALRKATKRALNAPRQASLDFLLAVEHALEGVLGFGFARFDVSSLLECPVNDDGVVVWPGNSGIPVGGIPGVLTMASDQASDQCCPSAFLKNKLKLNFEQFPDTCHLANNSTLSGCVKSGFQAIQRISVSIYNVRYGPQNHGTFFRYLETAALDASRLSPDDELVQTFWPLVCEDRQWDSEEQQSRDACFEWLQSLPCSRAATVKGPQTGTIRWYSYASGFWFWEGYWSETLFLGVYSAISQEWARRWTDIFKVDQTAAQTRAEEVRSVIKDMMAKLQKKKGGPADPLTHVAAPAHDAPAAGPAAASSSATAAAPAAPGAGAAAAPGASGSSSASSSGAGAAAAPGASSSSSGTGAAASSSSASAAAAPVAPGVADPGLPQ